MEMRSFRKAKEKGLVTVKKYGDSFNIEKRQFSPDHGEEIAPQVATVTRAEITAQRDAAQETVTEANALLAEFDALEGKHPV